MRVNAVELEHGAPPVGPPLSSTHKIWEAGAAILRSALGGAALSALTPSRASALTSKIHKTIAAFDRTMLCNRRSIDAAFMAHRSFPYSPLFTGGRLRFAPRPFAPCDL